MKLMEHKKYQIETTNNAVWNVANSQVVLEVKSAGSSFQSATQCLFVAA